MFYYSDIRILNFDFPNICKSRSNQISQESEILLVWSLDPGRGVPLFGYLNIELRIFPNFSEYLQITAKPEILGDWNFIGMILRPWPRCSTIRIFKYRTSNFSKFSPQFFKSRLEQLSKGTEISRGRSGHFFQKKLLVTFVHFGFILGQFWTILDNFKKILILVKILKNFLSD